MKQFIIRFLLAFILLSAAAGLVFTGCQQAQEEPFTSEVEYYKYGQLKNIYDHEILPLTSAFEKAAASLAIRAASFREMTDPEHLLGLQLQWEQTVKIWKQLELYDLGTVGESFISYQINRWPADTLKIEENVRGAENLDKSFIASIGSSSRGISALEYLLYAEGHPRVVQSFTSDENTDRRLDYLLALAEVLHDNSLEYRALWQSYGEPFTASLENGINGSQNLVINAMVSLLEEIIVAKLGAPLGDSSGGTPQPDQLEASRSGFSRETLRQNLSALQRCFTGDFSQSPFRVGFDDFLGLIGSSDLSGRILDQFNRSRKDLNAIPGTLEQQLASDPESIERLQNDLRDLLVLIKVDMANVLGSTITFNDNDGD